MEKNIILQTTQEFVKKALQNDPAHDWWHTYRVWQLAILIAKKEKADVFVVQLAALLHDVEDWKFKSNKYKSSLNLLKTRAWLRKCKIEDDTIQKITEIISNISFKGLNVKSQLKSLEGMIVQDADRLDAMGALGIARAFSYGGKHKRLIFDPSKKQIQSVFDLRESDSPSTIHHFYDKLLHLKHLMNTNTGKKIAVNRAKYLTTFLKQFMKEWHLKDTKN
ncbi:MAG: HD domain-containing protein [Bacteroidota bacterium]